MSQERFWNWMDDDSTFRMNSRDLVLIPYGRYSGFDKAVSNSGLVLSLEHSTDNKRKINEELVSTAPLGIWKSKQGVVIVEDDSIQLTLTAGHPSQPRIDLIVGEHQYVEALGGAFATYKVINGVAASNPVAPALTEDSKQVIIGQVYVPAGATTANACTYTKAKIPNFGDDLSIMHTDRDHEARGLLIFNKTRGTVATAPISTSGIVDTSIVSNVYVLVPPASGERYISITNFSHKLVGKGGVVWFYTSRGIVLNQFNNGTHRLVSPSAEHLIEANSMFGVLDVSNDADSFSTYYVIKGDEALKSSALARFQSFVYSRKSSGTLVNGSISVEGAKSNYALVTAPANSELKSIGSVASIVTNPNAVLAQEAGGLFSIHNTNALKLIHNGNNLAVGSKRLLLPNAENITVSANSIISFLEDTDGWKLLNIVNDTYSVVTLAKPSKLINLEDVDVSTGLQDGISLQYDAAEQTFVPFMVDDYIENSNLKMRKTLEFGANVMQSLNQVPLTMSGTTRILNWTVDKGNVGIFSLSAPVANTQVIHALPSTFQVGTELSFIATNTNVVGIMINAFDAGLASAASGALQIKRVEGNLASIYYLPTNKVIKLVRMPSYWLLCEPNTQADGAETDTNSASYIKNNNGGRASKIRTFANSSKVHLLDNDNTVVSEDLLYKNLKIEYGTATTLNRLSTNSGSANMHNNWDVNYVNLYPPSGFTTYDLKAFMPSISFVSYAGDVNSDDELYCKFKLEHNIFPSGRIRVIASPTENKKSTIINFIAIWLKS